MVDLKDYVPGGERLPRWLLNLGERALGFHTLNVAHYHIDEDWDAGSQDNFFKLACKHLNLNYDLSGIEHIPAEGPCVIVSNHPHGLSDGIMFGDIAMRVRQDVRIVVNEFLRCVFGMRPYSVTVDVYGGEEAKRTNMAGMRELLRWLRAGHCVLVFPSGSAASYSPQDGRVIDDPWQTNIAALIRKTGATVVPMHISGQTSAFFQLLTRIAKEKRSSFLPREIMRDGRTRHTIRLGKAISPTTMAPLETDDALSDYLRLRSMLLRYPQAAATAASAQPTRHFKPIEDSEPAAVMEAELAALPAECFCYAGETTGMKVYAAEAAQIPHIMHEIGVQRERTFRAVGEGTGESCDIDRYDSSYIHLFVWDERAHRLVGAYRIGRTDKLLAAQGVQGIYNAAFFELGQAVLDVFSKGLEMGRAFITPEYQKLPTSLDTLWMGIGRYLNAHPEYKYLYGTVSISGEYSELSRSLILSWLQQCRMDGALAPHIRAKNPPKGLGLLSEDARLLPTALPDTRALGSLVSELEASGRSVPVLLRQYLRLGGRMISFNIDEDFGGTLDCLVVVNMAEAPERVLRRYCGKEHAGMHLKA